MAFRGALVNRTTNFTGLTFPVTMQWDNLVEDTDGLWGVGGSLTRFTIPASGVAFVSLIACVRAPDGDQIGEITLSILRDGAAYASGTNWHRQNSGGTRSESVIAETPIIPVVAGNYFQARVNLSGLLASPPTQINFGNQTFFGIRIHG